MTRPAALAALAMIAFGVSAGCKAGKGDFDKPVVIAGRTVQPETLRAGEFYYMRWCVDCHGRKGHGDGQRAVLSPVPIPDFAKRAWPHAPVPAGQLPADSYFRRVIQHGIPGTPMEAVPVPAAQIPPLIAYVKYLATR